jgi:hypothetical protein
VINAIKVAENMEFLLESLPFTLEQAQTIEQVKESK